MNEKIKFDNNNQIKPNIMSTSFEIVTQNRLMRSKCFYENKEEIQNAKNKNPIKNQCSIKMHCKLISRSKEKRRQYPKSKGSEQFFFLK